ncbi:MAG: FkbM family methyltransferase [Litorimonas sp.]
MPTSFVIPFEQEFHMAKVEDEGKQFEFLLNNRRDHIQKFIAEGGFYEPEELALICEHAQGAKRLLDVGANIGNHCIYLAHHLDLDYAVPIEPQPAVLHLLKANLGLNWHRSFDLSHLGVGLANEDGKAFIGTVQEANLGGTHLRPAPENDGPGHSVPVYQGDSLFKAGDFDLIKIDAESMEIDVIKGLKNTLIDFSGVMFVEVHDDNASEFDTFIRGQGFHKRAEYRRYARCTNWMLTR